MQPTKGLFDITKEWLNMRHNLLSISILLEILVFLICSDANRRKCTSYCPCLYYRHCNMFLPYNFYGITLGYFSSQKMGAMVITSQQLY